MKKNIVLFSDGTGNGAAKINKTNVWRLYKALDLSHTGDINQLAHYDDGVGSSSFKLFAILGGALGWGLKRNVVDLYAFLCRHYQPGDRIYCFGFSRGAFTIRVLADLILHEGLVDRKHVKNESDLRYLALGAFRSYRKAKYPGRPWVEWMRAIRDKSAAIWHKTFGMSWYKKGRNVRVDQIKFIGLWDTVDAYGLPIEELTEAWKTIVPLALPDRQPSPRITRICHALALDDERHTFEPVLLDEETLDPARQYPAVDSICDEQVSQVWFAGVHSNVGGGYPDDGLARISLYWIMREADKHGLRFRELEWQHLREARDLDGRIYDSRRGLAGFYRYQPRRLERLTNDRKHGVKVRTAKIHQSVLQRIRDSPEYAPISLPERYTVVTDNGDIIEPGVEREAKSPKISPALLEDPARAKHRIEQQDRIWRLVWWRRLVYFLTVAAGLGLASFPMWSPATGACSGSWCGLAAIVNAIAVVLPGFLSPWYDAFASHPGRFFLAAGVLTGLLVTGGWLQHRIRDYMQYLWQDSGVKELGVSPADPTSAWMVRWLTEHPKFIHRHQYTGTMSFGKAALVYSTVALGVGLVVVGLGRLGFGMLSSSGQICTTSAMPSAGSPIPDPGKLESRSVCQPTGVWAEQGKRYRITLTLGQDWQDASLPATTKGVDNPTLPMLLATPLRRNVSEPWFKPLARIGSHGRDEYVLNQVEYHLESSPETKLVADITARTSGEIFLYVNDAILPVGNSWQYFYLNNLGTANYQVEPVMLSK